MAIMEFSLGYSLEREDPDATLTIPLQSIARAHLSVACRAERNRTALYQKRHLDAPAKTRERDPRLGALNRPLSDHYESFSFSEKKVFRYAPVIGFAISDLTANLLRPHYEASV